MSKPVKNLIIESYRARFNDIEGAVVVNIRGLASNNNNALRADLSKQDMRMSVVKNNLAKQAFGGTALEMLGELLDGPCAMVYGGESVVNVARVLIDAVKKHPAVEFKGALMEGQLFGAEEIEALSKYPTREEAQSQVIQVVLGPGSQVAGALVGVGNEIAGILATLEEKLEKGESVTKVA